MSDIIGTFQEQTIEHLPAGKAVAWFYLEAALAHLAVLLGNLDLTIEIAFFDNEQSGENFGGACGELHGIHVLLVKYPARVTVDHHGTARRQRQFALLARGVRTFLALGRGARHHRAHRARRGLATRRRFRERRRSAANANKSQDCLTNEVSHRSSSKESVRRRRRPLREPFPFFQKKESRSSRQARLARCARVVFRVAMPGPH